MLTRYEHFSYMISCVSRHIQKIERDEMEKYGHKGAYAQYLAAMSRYPQGVTSVQLCEICDKDKAAVSRAVTEMEDRGLIVRKSDNDSHYRAQILLTDEGRKLAEFVFDRAQSAVEAAGRGLTDSDRAVFYSALELISSNLQKLSRDGIPTLNKRSVEK